MKHIKVISMVFAASLLVPSISMASSKAPMPEPSSSDTDSATKVAKLGWDTDNKGVEGLTLETYQDGWKEIKYSGGKWGAAFKPSEATSLEYNAPKGVMRLPAVLAGTTYKDLKAIKIQGPVKFLPTNFMEVFPGLLRLSLTGTNISNFSKVEGFAIENLHVDSLEQLTQVLPIMIKSQINGNPVDAYEIKDGKFTGFSELRYGHQRFNTYWSMET